MSATQLPATQLLQQQRLSDLARQIQGVRAANRAAVADASRYSTGWPDLDVSLPDSGLIAGQLVEWLGADGCGMGVLSLLALREALNSGGMLVVVDRYHHFYPPAAEAMGLDLERITLIRPRIPDDAIWALDQALRCQAVTAVWAPWGELDWRVFRRLQLAAEEGETVGMLLRSNHYREEPSWAHVRLVVETRGAIDSNSRQASVRGSPDIVPSEWAAVQGGTRMVRQWTIECGGQRNLQPRRVQIEWDELSSSYSHSSS